MNRLAVCLVLVNLFVSGLAFGQWTQLGSNMPGDSESEFGNNVDFNYAGNIMIAGTNANYAKVHQEQSGVWTQLGNTITGPLGEGFGWAVSINGAGNIIAVGEFGGAGKVHVYELINNNWTPLGSAVEGGVHNGFFDNFGFSIDLNESGNRFVASSIYANLGNGEEAGFVQVYDWINGQWTQVGSTLQGSAAFSNFGWKVEMTADGSRFIVNADGGDESIYVFEEVNGDWQTIGQVFLNSHYGNSLLYNSCIDKIGNTIAFSQYSSPEVTRVFSLENDVWVEKGNAIPFRGYCSLNGNGSMIAISDPSILTSNGGIAKIYQLQSDDWIQLGQDIVANQDDFLGVCNDLNYAGNRFLVGLSGAGTGLTGATQVYENSSIPYAPIPYLTELPDILSECAFESIDAPLAYNSTDNLIEGITDTEFPITESMTIIWTYNDGNGFVSFQEQYVFVEDTQAPIPDAATLEILIAECEISTLTPPTASDNCASEIFVSHDVVLPIITQGKTIILWTYDDGKGNTATQEQVVLIADVSPPIPNAELLETITSECEVTSLMTPGATDNCTADVFVTNNITLPITEQGTTIVTWTYEDINGNITTQEQVVMINDTEAPVPDTESLPNILAVCQVDELDYPTATDNCSTSINVSHNAELPITAIGSTIISWTYDDGHGNIATQTQEVQISAIEVGVSISENTLMSIAENATYQWINCDTNLPIAGADDQSFTPTVSGNYAVIVGQNGCEETSDCTTVTVIGIYEIAQSSIGVYPNPTRGNITINLGKEYSASSIKLINALGQTILHNSYASQGDINFDIIEEPGIYLLEIETHQGTQARIRVIKN